MVGNRESSSEHSERPARSLENSKTVVVDRSEGPALQKTSAVTVDMSCVQSRVASLIPELDFAITSLAGQTASSSSSEALISLRQELENRQNQRDFGQVQIRRITAGLSLPSWMPKVFRSIIGSQDEYLPVAGLVRETLQNPQDIDNVKGLAQAIARVPEAFDRTEFAPRGSCLQSFKMDCQGSSRSSTSRRLRVAQKKDELRAIKEQRAEAELEIIEAEEETVSRYSGQTDEELANRLAMVGLRGDNNQETERSRLAKA